MKFKNPKSQNKCRSGLELKKIHNYMSRKNLEEIIYFDIKYKHTAYLNVFIYQTSSSFSLDIVF